MTKLPYSRGHSCKLCLNERGDRGRNGAIVTPYRHLIAWAAIAFAAFSHRRSITGKRACQMAGCLLLFWANTLAAEQVRVMQWNVKSALGNIAQNKSAAAKAIARIVNYNQPDILLFCEVTNAVTGSGGLAADTTALRRRPFTTAPSRT